MLEALDSNQKSRLLAEQTTAPAACHASPPPHQSHPGEAELAYLTHEGLFISDALSDAQRAHGGPQEKSSGLGPRPQHGGAVEPEGSPRPQQGEAVGPDRASSDSASGTTESSSGRDQGFLAAGGAVSL